MTSLTSEGRVGRSQGAYAKPAAGGAPRALLCSRMDPISLVEVLTRARRSLALNFPQALWVKAELSSVTERRGHRYLQLVQKQEGDAPVAKCQAVVWSKAYRQVLRKRGHTAAEVLVEGQEVCLQVEVDFHELYGFKLMVADWDPAFTIGQLELRRRAILDSLTARGLLGANRKLPLPLVVQRLAVITSVRAAGYADFTAQLANNPYGYHFEVTLYDASVQGANTEATVVEALRTIAANASAYDAVLILRGGGSKLDLASFDNEAIGVAIAESTLPVLVGIGHEIDETLPDLVAHSSLKTPTALAEFVILRAAAFESDLLNRARLVARWAERTRTTHERELAASAQAVERSAAQVLVRKRIDVERAGERLRLISSAVLQRARQALSAQAEALTLLDPQATLARGYALVSSAAGERLRSADGLTAGDRVELHFRESTATAEIV